MEYLRSIQEFDEEAILQRIEALQDHSFLRAMERFDFSSDFMEGGQGQNLRNLYDLVSELVLKKGITEAIQYLTTIFGDLDSSSSS